MEPTQYIEETGYDPRLSLGVDPALTSDYCALVLSEIFYNRGGHVGRVFPLAMKRLEKGITLADIRKEVIDTISTVKASKGKAPTVMLDINGIGVGLYEMLLERKVDVVGIKTVAGEIDLTKVQNWPPIYEISKSVLMNKYLKVYAADRRLEINPSLPFAAEMKEEVEGLGYETTAARHLKVEGRGRPDDLIMALAYSVLVPRGSVIVGTVSIPRDSPARHFHEDRGGSGIDRKTYSPYARHQPKKKRKPLNPEDVIEI